MVNRPSSTGGEASPQTRPDLRVVREAMRFSGECGDTRTGASDSRRVAHQQPGIMRRRQASDHQP